MFQFGRFPTHTYVFSVRSLILHQGGFPIRKSAGRNLFAAHRSLSQLVTSFVGSWCQGIPLMLFLAWTLLYNRLFSIIPCSLYRFELLSITSVAYIFRSGKIVFYPYFGKTLISLIPQFFLMSFSLCLILSLFVYLILSYSVFNEHRGFRLLTALAVN